MSHAEGVPAPLRRRHAVGRWRRTIGLLVVLSPPLSLAGATAAAQSHALDPFPTVGEAFGVNVHTLEPADDELALLHRAGLHTVRTDFNWAQTERRPGGYDFRTQTRFLGRLRAAGLRCMFVLDYSNEIYGIDGRPPFTPRGRAAFARWAAAAMQQCRGQDVVWEVWNEPNGKWFWPNPNAADYARLLRSVREAARRATPAEAIVGPAMYGADVGFLDACGRAGCFDDLDAVTVHPYRSTGPESAAQDYDRLRAVLSRFPSARRPLLVQGEWGYQTRGPGAERDRAKLLLRSFVSGLADRIPLSIWYDWMDDAEAMGIVRQPRAGERPGLVPEAGCVAAEVLADTLGPYRFERRLDIGDPAADFVLAFDHAGRHRYVAWTTAGTPKRVTLPVPDGDYRLVDGLNERPATTVGNRHRSLSLSISDVPVYVCPATGPP